MNDPQTRAYELIQNYYAAFNRGDREGMLGLLTEDVVHDINQGEKDIGRDAFCRFLQHMDECYAEQVHDLVVFASNCGTRAAAEFFIAGQYLTTDDGLPPAHGQKYHLRVGAFFELREGCIARVTNYYNLKDWLQQVAAN